MGSGSKKRKANPMGDYVATEEQRKAMRWCINNQIRMWPKPTVKGGQADSWWIEIQIGKGGANRSPESYGPGEIWEQMFNYYEYYYGKYRKQSDTGDSDASDNG